MKKLIIIGICLLFVPMVFGEINGCETTVVGRLLLFDDISLKGNTQMVCLSCHV